MNYVDELFAEPRRDVKISDCQFYHTMELPGYGLVTAYPGAGGWDMRGKEDDFFGHLELSGKRLLEIGPASGFLTFEAEKRGAEVVSVEAPEDHKFDIVPFPGAEARWQLATKRAWKPCTDAYWFAHQCFKSHARVYYGDAYTIPQTLGRFDIALLSNVLLHNRDPLKILQNCASLTEDMIIVVDSLDQDLESLGKPVLKFLPNPSPAPGRHEWNMWWRFSTSFFENALRLLGFPLSAKHFYTARCGVYDWPLFTLVASRVQDTAAHDHAARAKLAERPGTEI
jgi:SAM-dependent methyltransferase